MSLLYAYSLRHAQDIRFHFSRKYLIKVTIKLRQKYILFLTVKNMYYF